MVTQTHNLGINGVSYEASLNTWAWALPHGMYWIFDQWKMLNRFLKFFLKNSMESLYLLKKHGKQKKEV